MLILPKKDVQYSRRFIEQNPVLYYRYILKLIQAAIKNNLDSVQVFQMKDSAISGHIRKAEYNDALQSSMKYFVKYEEYELAERAKQLLRKLSVSKLLEEIDTTDE